jgi:flagellar protein FlgJ
MIEPSGSNSFALNVKALDQIKSENGHAPKKALRQAAQQFESLLLQKMLHSMREAVPKAELTNGQRTRRYEHLLDSQLAQKLSSRGIGLADMLVQQLSPGLHSRQDSVSAAERDATHSGLSQTTPSPTGLKTARPKALGPSQAAEYAQHQVESSNANQWADTGSLVNRGNGSPLISKPSATGIKQSVDNSRLPAHARKFVEQLAAPARQASHHTGVSARLILAQAALESGWGKHEVTDASGRSGFNVFNVKAGDEYSGKTTTAATKEFENGSMQSAVASFRDYDSYRQSFADYARLIANSPRYNSVINAPNDDVAADRLQQSGYATDPDYAQKLKRIMAEIPEQDATGVTPLISSGGKPLINGAESPENE